MVKSKTPGPQGTQGIMKALGSKINPVASGQLILVHSTVTTKNSMIVKCPDNDIREALIMKWNPRLAISYIDLNIFNVSDNVLINDIISLNELKDSNTYSFNLIIIEVPSNLRKSLLTKRSLYVEWQSCVCSDHIYTGVSKFANSEFRAW
jgi:hypothetical protein